MRSGRVPASSSRITRRVSTCVLPVPALALTHADAAGSEASDCAFVVLASSRPMSSARWPGLEMATVTPVRTVRPRAPDAHSNSPRASPQASSQGRWTGPIQLTIRAELRRRPDLPRGYAQVAQLVEHATENRSVGGSIPPLGTIRFRGVFPLPIAVRHNHPTRRLAGRRLDSHLGRGRSGCMRLTRSLKPWFAASTCGVRRSRRLWSIASAPIPETMAVHRHRTKAGQTPSP